MQESWEGRHISGILNNCSMNAALPLLLKDIEILVAIEERNHLPGQLPTSTNIEDLNVGEEYKSPEETQRLEEISHDDAIYKSYQLLKNVFCATYGLPEITWEQFHTFLNLPEHETFLAKQLLFLPVFRNFIGETARGTYNLEKLTKIQNYDPFYAGETQYPGKYNPLDASDVIPLFYQHFGISVSVFKPKEKAEEDEAVEEAQEDVENEYTQTSNYDYHEPLPRWLYQNRHINLYNRGNHFEMLQGQAFALALIQQRNDFDRLDRGLLEAWEFFTETDSASHTARGMHALIHYVNCKLNPNYTSTITFDNYLKNRNQFNLKTPKGRKTFALILLNLVADLDEYHIKCKRLLQSVEDQDKIAQAIINSRSLAECFVTLDTANQTLITAINLNDTELFIQAIDAGCDLQCSIIELEDGSIRLATDEEYTNPAVSRKLLLNYLTRSDKHSNLNKYLRDNPSDLPLPPTGANTGEDSNNEQQQRRRNLRREQQNSLNQEDVAQQSQSHSLAFKIFTSIYAKLLMTVLLIAAALTLTALLINTSQLPTAVATFIINLTPRAFDAIFGASIAVGAVSGIGLIASTTLSNCNSGLFCKEPNTQPTGSTGNISNQFT